LSNKENIVDQYGWNDDKETDAHDYMAEPILNIIGVTQSNKILDLGCGNGSLTRKYIQAGYDVTGCDADEEGVRQAGRLGGNYLCYSIYDEPKKFPESDYDFVVSAEVVEHLFKPTSLPYFAHEVLKDDGYFLITTPYHGYIKNLVLSIFNKWDGHLDPFWDGGHIKFWSKKSLTKLLENAGFKIISFHGVGRFPFLWKSMMILAQKK